MGNGRWHGDVLTAVVERARMASADQVTGIVADVLGAAGAGEVGCFVVDYAQTALVPLAGSAAPAQTQPVDTTPAGAAFRGLIVQQEQVPAGRRLWVPLIDGVDRVGVLRLVLPADAAGDGEVRRHLLTVASVVAELLTTKSQYGDHLARRARTRPMSLAAEMQWQLLPPLTFGMDRVVLAGLLEPCYEVGGDVFDYAVDATTLRFAVLDAMGHGVQASMMSALAVSAYRNARREGYDLLSTAAAMDAAVAAQFTAGQFVTAVLAELDLDEGELRWLLLGHPPPLLLRRDAAPRRLAAEPAPPLGLGAGAVPEVAGTRLEPGDRVLAFTDGVVEARSPGGEFLGEQRLADLASRTMTTDLPTAEVMRQLTHAVLAHQQGQLQDDATQLLVEWRSGTDQRLAPRWPVRTPRAGLAG